MDSERRLFLPHVSSRHPSAVKEHARMLCIKLAELREILPILENPNGKEELKFFSNLYVESVPILTAIDCYVNENGLAKRRKIDNYIERAKKILGHLKILHLRWQSISILPAPEDKPAWYRYSQLENREIMVELKQLINEM